MVGILICLGRSWSLAEELLFPVLDLGRDREEMVGEMVWVKERLRARISYMICRL